MSDPNGPKRGGPSEGSSGGGGLDRRLDDLDRRLAAKDRERTEEQAKARGAGAGASGIGMAFRLSTEFVAGIVVGGGIGWALDRALGSSPWFLLIFFFLGFAAGLLNMMRAAAKPTKPNQDGRDS